MTVMPQSRPGSERCGCEHLISLLTVLCMQVYSGLFKNLWLASCMMIEAL
jgi:hypothetical protein